ncbi:MAG: hypothetical protein J7K23_04150 [Thermoproteales archaeon]|nr:hypothetical protein [Thermoproteales archaeon]
MKTIKMEAKRLVVLGIIGLFLLPSLAMLSVDASAQLEKPKWHEGDYWDYDVTMVTESISLSGHEHVEVKQAKTIVIEGQEYYARMVTIHVNTTGQYLGSTYSVEGDIIKYYNEEDVSLMKYIEDSSITGHTEVVYSFPFVGMEYPITVNKEWWCNTTMTSGITHQDINLHYKCIGKTDVNTKAGLFPCFIIKSRNLEDDEDVYELWYISQKTGYMPVMREQYENGEKTYQEKLTSFRYFEKEKKGIPGFEIAFLIIVMISIIMLRRKGYKY